MSPTALITNGIAFQTNSGTHNRAQIPQCRFAFGLTHLAEFCPTLKSRNICTLLAGALSTLERTKGAQLHSLRAKSWTRRLGSPAARTKLKAPDLSFRIHSTKILIWNLSARAWRAASVGSALLPEESSCALRCAASSSTCRVSCVRIASSIAAAVRSRNSLPGICFCSNLARYFPTKHNVQHAGDGRNPAVRRWPPNGQPVVQGYPVYRQPV